MKKFEPKRCGYCTQTEEYILTLDKGSAKIVLFLLNLIVKKGRNETHPTYEANFQGKEKWFVTNLSRPRFHGLIAYVKDKPGHYCLTRKAGKFLQNLPVSKHAIISKVTGHQEGYWNGETEMTTMRELLKEDKMWNSEEEKMINYLADETNQEETLFQ